MWWKKGRVRLAGRKELYTGRQRLVGGEERVFSADGHCCFLVMMRSTDAGSEVKIWVGEKMR